MSDHTEAITTQPGANKISDVFANLEPTEQSDDLVTDSVEDEENKRKIKANDDCCICCYPSYDVDNDVDTFCLVWFYHMLTDCIRCTCSGCYECCTGCGDCDCGDCDCGDCDCNCGDCDCDCSD